MAGLTATGFEIKTTATVTSELATDVKGRLGNVNTQADSILGVLLGVFAARIGELWELGEALYRAFDPSTSDGDALHGLAELTGTVAEAAAPSTVVAAVDLSASTTLTAGALATVEDAPSREFSTDTTVASATIRKWHRVELTATEDGPTVAEAGTLNQISTAVAGWNAIINEPVPATRWSTRAPPLALINGWTLQLDIGTGTQTATFNTGDFVNIAAATLAEVAVVINADTTGLTATVEGTGSTARLKIESDVDGDASVLTVVGGTAAATIGLISTTVYGVTGAAAELGRLDETDAELRARRGNELERQGTSTGESLRARLLELDGVTDAAVYQNRTETIDGDGLAPKSFRAVILEDGVVDAEVGQVVFENSPLGIQSQGTQTVTIVDSQGVSVPVYWDEATEIPIYVSASISVLASAYAGDVAVKAAVAAYVAGLLMGDDVIAEAAKGRLFQAGVYDVTAYAIDTVDPPVASANIAIGLDEAPTLDVANIDLTVAYVTPS